MGFLKLLILLNIREIHTPFNALNKTYSKMSYKY